MKETWKKIRWYFINLRYRTIPEMYALLDQKNTKGWYIENNQLCILESEKGVIGNLAKSKEEAIESVNFQDINSRIFQDVLILVRILPNGKVELNSPKYPSPLSLVIVPKDGGKPFNAFNAKGMYAALGESVGPNRKKAVRLAYKNIWYDTQIEIYISIAGALKWSFGKVIIPVNICVDKVLVPIRVGINKACAAIKITLKNSFNNWFRKTEIKEIKIEVSEGSNAIIIIGNDCAPRELAVEKKNAKHVAAKSSE